MEKKKKGIGKWIAIAIVAIIIIGVAAGGGSDKDSKKNESEKVGTVADSSSDAKKDTAAEDSSDAKEDADASSSEDTKDETYHPGDVVSFGDFEIAYKSAKNYKSDNSFIKAKDGYKYVRFAFNFKNKGDTDSYPGTFACYVDNTKCDQAVLGDDTADFLLQEISSGRELDGSITFEVPDTAKLKDVELEYENMSLLSDKKIMFIGE